MVRYCLDNQFGYTREDLVDFAERRCNEIGAENIRNCLPAYSIRKNCEHHPIRILLELGHTVQKSGSEIFGVQD